MADTGIGIPTEEPGEVFSKYLQVNNPERDQTRGLGLGLTIVRRLCDMMDAELGVESKLG